METTVENLFQLLARSKLLPPEEVQAARLRWQHEAGKVQADARQLSQWLASHHYVTEYQAGVLLRGHADHFFFNEYKILDRIAKGKMAGVYKAVHRLGQAVAIKVLPPSRAKDPETFARFQREARLALRLKHPNVVRSYQVGQAGALHYLVMEYLEGETLEELLRQRGQLPPAEAVPLIHQALLGLQHIHEQGMVHRDLNPGNLMLVQARGSQSVGVDVVKILDIGLGRAIFDDGAPAAAAEAGLTKEGALLGTPDYLAPEQARDAHAADVRSDIYSLGCILYHCLAGMPPFPDQNAVRQMMRHAKEPARPLQAFNPAVPEVLQQIIDGMMAKDPGQRYPTPDRAAKALRIFLHSETVPISLPLTAPPLAAYVNWLEGVPEVAAPAAVPLGPGAGGQPPALAGTARPFVPPTAAAFTPPVRRGGSAPIDAAAIDVELVPLDHPGNQSGMRRVLLPSRRTWLFLLLSPIGILAAAGLGWYLSQQLLRKKQSNPVPNPDSTKKEK